MREPDPEVIRMFQEGARLQVYGIPNDVTVPRPTIPDHWIETPATFSCPSDYGIEGHRRYDCLDDDEPAATRDAWNGHPAQEIQWPA